MEEHTGPASAGTSFDHTLDQELDEAAALLYRDPVRSASLITRVEIAIDGRRDLERAARAHQLRGDLQNAAGDRLGAMRSYQSARHGWLAAGKQLEAREAMLGRTRVILASGEYDDVLGAVGRIQAGLDELGNPEERLTTRIHQLAHQQLGDARAGRGELDLARRHYDFAEDLARDLGDGHQVAEVGRRRGTALLAAGLAHGAIDELRRARRTYLEVGSVLAAASTVLPIAEALAATGEVVAALELVDRISPELAGNGPALAELDLVRATVLLRAGLAGEAHSRSAAAESVFTSLGMMERSARAAFVCAAASLRLRRSEAAETELAAAEQLYAECGARTLRDTTRLLQARVALASGDTATALRISRRLVDGDALTANPVAVRARLLVARATEDMDAAESMIASASESVARLGHPELRLELRLVRALHLRRIGRTRAAIDQLRQAHELGRVWSARTPVRSHATGEFCVAEATDELIAVLLEHGGHAGHVEAWQRASVAKSSALGPLSDRTRGWNVDDADDADIDDVIARVHDVRRATPTEPETGPPPVPEGPLVDYYVLDDDVLAFVIREGQVHVRRLSKVAAESRRLVTAWQQECVLLAATRPMPGASSSSALDALYSMLIAPLADLLSDLESEPLRVVGHRHLHWVPFDALLDVAAPWRNRVAPAEADRPGPAAVHPSEAPPGSALVLAVSDDHAPAIDAEAAMIAATLPGAEVYLGEQATRKVLAARAYGVDVVHLAAHGAFRNGNPLFSALRLGDGWLRAVDLLEERFDLDGSVVVLSACGSGLTSDATPQPVGLVWACLAAGAGAVVAALWSVDDEVTLELMSHFYGHLAAGDHPRVALGKARRQVAAERPHPFFWAAFRYFTLPAS
ncbi:MULTISPECIES: CHAT domain-containing protein [Nocardioides]|uniref:CHAT domain-containing protein n=1 Tax=Nocardioides vastitatis TaxID=2568655 RepID=A0ABW0ZCR6_9ACTN|nr:CHAT domain-containing protein [Nocardioides sp.]THI98863.1 CHAT domain-containing protein [Nocardioides sp.]